MPGISEDMSFLEMLDIVNDRLIGEGEEPIAFEHDCREGICGSCGMMINGQAHGPQRGTATCQLHMRKFDDGDVINVEPWRRRGVPGREGPRRQPQRVRPHHRGRRLHHASTPGAAPEANLIPVPKVVADAAFDAAACIGCGACVAACPNGAGAAVHVGQGRRTSTCCRRARPSATRGSRPWSTPMEEYFGSCTNHGECEEACPKSISIDYIALMNRDYVKAKFKNRRLRPRR